MFGNQRMWKKAVLLLVGLILMAQIKAEEELCPLTREEGSASCSKETKIDKEDELVILEESKEDIKKESDDGYCHMQGDQKKCGEEIQEESPDIKSEYYAKKTKALKKPQGEKIEFPADVKYENLFLKKGHEHDEYVQSFSEASNYTDYFDFTMPQEDLEYVKEVRFAAYPDKNFKQNSQGNFPHFYKIAYEKELPVLFTTDSMLYAFNENVHRVMTTFLENAYIFALKRFFENLVFFGEQLKEKPELEKYKIIISHAQIYYGCGVEFLSDGFSEYKSPEDISTYIKAVTKLAKKFTGNTFGFMMKQRFLNTKSLIPSGLWRRSKKLGNLYITMRWFQIVRFDMRRELKIIYILGKFIVDSGNTKAFKELKEMNKYLIGEDRTTPNYAEVYEIGKELFGEYVYELDDIQVDQLNSKITQKVEGKDYKLDLNFSGDYIFGNRESFEKFRYEKEDISHLFNRANTLEEWVWNKMITLKKEGPRMMVSSFEMIDIMHHAGVYRTMTFNRYKWEKSFEHDQLMEHRDGIDMKENFEKTKYSIKHSMEKEPQNWKKNLQNHYHYLLYKLTRRIKHSNDKLYKDNIMKENVLYTSWGAYSHFKRQIMLMTAQMSSAGPKKETKGIPEVVLEPHLEFYKEMESFWNTLKGNISQYIYSCEYIVEVDYSPIKEELKGIFDPMNDALSLILKGIKLQESGRLNEEFRKQISNLIWYNKDMNRWDGWYANLFEAEKMFSQDVWISSLGVFPEIEELKFRGANLQSFGKFNQFGIVVTEDPSEKIKKMLLFSRYNIREIYSPVEDKPDIEELTKQIMDRD